MIGHRTALSCSLDEVAGAGRVAPQKLTITAAQVEPVLPYNEADENGEQDCFGVPPVNRTMKEQKDFVLLLFRNEGQQSCYAARAKCW